MVMPSDGFLMSCIVFYSIEPSSPASGEAFWALIYPFWDIFMWVYAGNVGLNDSRMDVGKELTNTVEWPFMFIPGSFNRAAVLKWYVCGNWGPCAHERMHTSAAQSVCFLAEMCAFVTDLLLLSPEWMLGTSALLFSLFIALCLLFCLSSAVDLLSGA